MDNAKFQNYGCKVKLIAEISDYFSCANRKDKSDFLFDFDQPPVPTKKAFQGKNYNVELSFDSERIYCQTHNFSYEEFAQVTYYHELDLCHLKNGQSIALIQLMGYLLTDFTFEYSSKIAEFQ